MQIILVRLFDISTGFRFSKNTLFLKGGNTSLPHTKKDQKESKILRKSQKHAKTVKNSQKPQPSAISNSSQGMACNGKREKMEKRTLYFISRGKK